jgi:putative transposase
MIRAHKIRLHPREDQRQYFYKASGTARYAYNWAVAQWQAVEGKKPTAMALKKQFNAEKPEWAYEVTKCAAEGAFFDFRDAVKNFYEKRANAPQFKSRKKGHFSFYLANDKFKVKGHWVRVPKLGWVNMAERLRFHGRILGASISKEADWWYISITVEMLDLPQKQRQPCCGIDVGIARLATTSDGIGFDNERPLKHHLDRLAALQRLLAKKEKGSKNREKLKRKIGRVHKRVRHLRGDVLEKLSHSISRVYGFVGLEDLNVEGMLQNRRLAQALQDSALGKLLYLIETKVHQRGGEVVIIDRFFASSKTCSNCKHKNPQLTLSDRVYICPNCGLQLDRDLNAAINILHEAQRLAQMKAAR